MTPARAATISKLNLAQRREVSGLVISRVYRVWGKEVDKCVWLKASSAWDAVWTVSRLKILTAPLSAAVDEKVVNMPPGVLLDSDGNITNYVT